MRELLPSSMRSLRGAIACLLLIGLPLQAEESFAARSARMKREHEQRVKQMQKEFDQQTKSAATSTTSKTATPKGARPAPNTTSAKFNPQAAPRPEESFNAFLTAARNAKSFSEILPYLPADKREYYEREQKAYDPAKARERRLRYEKEGTLDADAIVHLTQPPYEGGLKFYQSVARKVDEFVAARTSGDRAYLDVTIHINEVINGQRMTKSTATIGMVGEGSFWKFESFKEGIFAER